MISTDGRVIGWGIIIWIGLISLLSYSAVAKSHNPTDLSEKSPEIEAVTPDTDAPSAEQAPASDSLAVEDDTAAVQAQEAAPEVEAVTPDTDAPSAKQAPASDSLAVEDDAAAVQAQEAAPEVEAVTPDTDAPSAEQAPTFEALPDEDAAAAQGQEEAMEIEAATPDAPAPLTEQAPQAEDVPASDDTVSQEKRPLPQTEGALSNTPLLPSQDQTTEAMGADDATLPESEPSQAVEGQSALTVPPVIEKKPLSKSIFRNIETSCMLASGIRKDDFQWSIAGNGAGTNPNVLSELTWSDVDSYYVALSNRTIFNRNLYFRGLLDYAFIQNGRIQDSDYRLDNRQDEYSRSISNSGGDQIWDISIAAGYPFYFLQDRFMVVPLLGYSHHTQNLRIQDGNQVITWAGGPALGPLDGLNSTYRSAWSGPWFGCDLTYHPSKKGFGGKWPMTIGLSVEYHYADYEAEANWNLRSDFQHPVSFEHFADGHGISLSAEWLIGLSAQWDFVFQTTFQRWKTGNGLDKVYNSDSTIDQASLNGVEWRNHSLVVGANYHF